MVFPNAFQQDGTPERSYFLSTAIDYWFFDLFNRFAFPPLVDIIHKHFVHPS